MSTIIIITPPPTKPPGAQRDSDTDGFAQDMARTSPYAEALQAIADAEANGQRVRIIGD